MIKRNKRGQFVKGIHPATEFKKGDSKLENAYTFPNGSTHPNWVGGKTNHSGGYINVRLSILPESKQSFFEPMFSNNGACLEHRLVVALYLNRALSSKESVHHINGIKKDNRLENLYLFKSESEHQLCEWSSDKANLISNLSYLR